MLEAQNKGLIVPRPRTERKNILSCPSGTVPLKTTDGQNEYGVIWDPEASRQEPTITKMSYRAPLSPNRKS